jgi:hypothetical protein
MLEGIEWGCSYSPLELMQLFVIKFSMCDFRYGFLAMASITLLLSRVEEMSISRNSAIRFDPISSHNAFSLISWHSFK